MGSEQTGNQRIDDEGRSAAYQKDAAAETRLKNLNAWLAPVSEAALPSFDAGTRPVVFVLGLPRSGTTLIAQALAATGAFAYPSNFLARFWEAPVVGLRIQQALGIGCEGEGDFKSDYGVTSGWSDPHEFAYFWERWLRFSESHVPDAAGLTPAAGENLRRELDAFEGVVEKPVFFKSLMLLYATEWLEETLGDRAHFVIVRRDPLATASSILKGKRERLAHEGHWFSLRPASYASLKDLPPVEQVAAQVHALSDRLDAIADGQGAGHRHRVCYEEFCADPRGQVIALLEAVGGGTDGVDRLPESFSTRPVPERGADADCDALRAALENVDVG